MCSFYASAQTTLPIAPVFQKTYQKETRNANGKPGKHYWQNTSKYNLNVDFNPGSRLLKGKVQVTYTNNSPDTLKEIWFKLYPNLYKRVHQENQNWQNLILVME